MHVYVTNIYKDNTIIYMLYVVPKNNLSDKRVGLLEEKL